MTAGFYFLEVMVLVLLAVVGALVIWIHFRLTALSRAKQKMPILAETLSNSMTQAYEGISRLDEAIKNHSPELDKRLVEAGKTLHELDYVLDRAEKLLTRLDNTFAKLGNGQSEDIVSDNSGLAGGNMNERSSESHGGSSNDDVISRHGGGADRGANITYINGKVQQKSQQMAAKLGETLAGIPLVGSKGEDSGEGEKNNTYQSERDVLTANLVPSAIQIPERSPLEQHQLEQELNQPLRKTSSKRGSEIYGAVAREIEVSEAEEELHRALAGRI